MTEKQKNGTDVKGDGATEKHRYREGKWTSKCCVPSAAVKLLRPPSDVHDLFTSALT